MKTKILWFAASLLLSAATFAQTNCLYTFQDLSHFYYARTRDSLRKAWTCPPLFKVKATQKKYKEIWDRRTGRLTTAINGDDYVHDNEIHDYLESIVRQLMDGNHALFPERPLLLIDRSQAVNAYALGGNVLAVDLGLITFSQTREELAFAIAHELSHNILHHYENAMRQKAEWITSEGLSPFKKVPDAYTFSRDRHQRYHESEADSLAIVLLRHSNIPFDAGYFLRLDSSDLQYRQPFRHPLSAFFAAYHLPYQESWTQRHTHANSFSETAAIGDPLKTHPDCIDRYNKTRNFSTANAHFTPIPQTIRDKANKMLLWNLYSAENMTSCLYRIVLIKDKGNIDTWYDFMLSNIFAGLYYSDRVLNRFNAIGTMPVEYISKDYYALQTLLEQMPRESLERACKILEAEGFWKNLPSAEKDLKTFVFTLALDPDSSDANKARAAHTFASGNATSMYCEFARNFEKK